VRGGQRHLLSLASKVNQAIAKFPNATPPAAMHQQKRGYPARSRTATYVEPSVWRYAMTLWRRSMTSRRRLYESSIRYVLRLTRRCRPRSPAIRLMFARIRHSCGCQVLRSGSGGGPDGLRPQQLKDLTNASAGDAGRRLLTRFTEFANLCLTGRVQQRFQHHQL
jgi:hypothetical protein